jgi:hypothetical protein
MTINKWLLIYESHSDLNQCASCRRNKIHTTRTHSWQAIRGNLLRRHQRSWPGPLLPRKRAPDIIPSPSVDRFMGPHPVSLPNQPLKKWRQSQASVAIWLHRFTRPITSARDQYIKYLLTGVNPSVLNQHRWGLQHWRCWLSISLSPPFPTNGPPLSPTGLTRSHVNHANISLQQYECIRPYRRHVVFRPLTIYWHLCLCLAIANDLPLQWGTQA